MSLQKSVPKNKTIYFNNLQSHTTGSIPVSPTISTKIKYIRNNKDLACKPLKLLGYFYYPCLKCTYLILNTYLKISQKIGVFTPQIVCKSLLDFFQLLLKHNKANRFFTISIILLEFLKVYDNDYHYELIRHKP